METVLTVRHCRLLMTNSQFCHGSSSLPFLKPVAVPKLPVLRHSLAVSTVLKSIIRTPSSIKVAASMASTTSFPAKLFSVLFVCLGNICRSPAVEGVFGGIVREKGLESKFMIDSAGTIDYHENAESQCLPTAESFDLARIREMERDVTRTQGNPADSWMRDAVKKDEIELTFISRPIKLSDFIDFDLIPAMDKQNRADIFDAYSHWKDKASLPAEAYEKVKLMYSYCKKHKDTEVPDPYYGGPQGFEQVYSISYSR